MWFNKAFFKDTWKQCTYWQLGTVLSVKICTQLEDIGKNKKLSGIYNKEHATNLITNSSILENIQEYQLFAC